MLILVTLGSNIKLPWTWCWSILRYNTLYIEKVDLSTCEYCLVGKSARKSYGKRTRAECQLQLIHSDICGPMNVGASYFITFIDDYTHYGYVYLIVHKSETLDCFKRFMNFTKKID